MSNEIKINEYKNGFTTICTFEFNIPFLAIVNPINLNNVIQEFKLKNKTNFKKQEYKRKTVSR